MTIPQPKTRDDLIALLSITDPDELQALYDAAYAVKAAGVGRVVYYRGLVEFSNYCIKDCKYCGIRKSNDEVERFDTPREDILAMARWAWENRYGSLTLQSGERQDEEFIDYVEGLVRDIKALSHGELGLTSASVNRRKKRTAAGSTPAPTAISCASKRATLTSTRRSIPRTAITAGRSVRTAWTACAASATRSGQGT